ncbi:hypothetical protein BH09ACT5_BH09ACT5_03760 [soil metagenome]
MTERYRDGMTARGYQMRARADSTASTQEAILTATIALAYELARLDFSLEQVAERANRSVQTILRHFGSRDALFEAAIQRGMAEVAAERRAPDADPARALDLLVDHYEQRGRFVLRLLALEDDRGAESVTGPGRLLHRQWVEDVFAGTIESAVGDRDALVDELVVVTDVYAWKLLRLDRGLDTPVVRERLGAMVEAIIASARTGGR